MASGVLAQTLGMCRNTQTYSGARCINQSPIGPKDFTIRLESRQRAKKKTGGRERVGPGSHAAGGSAGTAIGHFAITLLNKQILIGLCAGAFLFDPCRSGVQGKACYKVNGDSMRWDIPLNPGRRS
ncbi:protein of unknown function [Methylocella tundrae]|uniref:Uncharacterized protein n=1 Tax=Methylocella tundrae TaxID=227605 RepID=A0A4U8Z0L9_METTU|nr:protein of unknown function [Methylocella tundrae]